MENENVALGTAFMMNIWMDSRKKGFFSITEYFAKLMRVSSSLLIINDELLLSEYWFEFLKFQFLTKFLGKFIEGLFWN
jgi:hypothetical protein